MLIFIKSGYGVAQRQGTESLAIAQDLSIPLQSTLVVVGKRTGRTGISDSHGQNQPDFEGARLARIVMVPGIQVAQGAAR